MNTRQFNYQNCPQWQIDIINRYPLIYRVPNPKLLDYFSKEDYEKLIADPHFCNLRFGFECGEGWAKLIGEFSNVCFETLHIIERLYPGNFDNRKYYICAFIFKEKFGGIRWQGDSNLPYPFNELFNSHVRAMGNRERFL